MAEVDYSTEEWRDIPGYEGWYQVSSSGRIKSLARETPTRNRWGPTVYRQREKIIEGRTDSYDYRRHSTCVAGKIGSIFAHTAVALAFVGPRPSPDHQVAHWDGDKQNNTPGNLRWATPAENCQDKVRHGVTANQFGERHSQNKLTEEQVRTIRRTPYFRGFDPHFAAMFGVQQQAIGKVRRRERWPHVE